VAAVLLDSAGRATTGVADALSSDGDGEKIDAHVIRVGSRE
jgi:hypothetical protein